MTGAALFLPPMCDPTPNVRAPYRHWTTEDDNRLRSYASKIPAHEIGKLLQRTRPAVFHRMKALGIENHYVRPRTYDRDDAFFSVPNAINSYYAGYIAADGSIDGKEHAVRWSAEETDRGSLEGFKKHTRYEGPIGFKLNMAGLGKNPSRQNFLDVYGAAQWCKDLEENFGVVPQKTHRVEPPHTASDFLNACFIRGYIDGDGSISFTDRGSWAISVTSCSPRILEFIKAFVDRHFTSEFTTRRGNVNHYENHYVYIIKGYRAIQFFEFMRALPVPMLARKWDNPEILRVMEIRKAKHPELFKVEKVLSFDPSGTIVHLAEIESMELRDVA